MKVFSTGFSPSKMRKPMHDTALGSRVMSA
jgi:hypothetical protein